MLYEVITWPWREVWFWVGFCLLSRRGRYRCRSAALGAKILLGGLSPASRRGRRSYGLGRGVGLAARFGFGPAFARIAVGRYRCRSGALAARMFVIRNVA